MIPHCPACAANSQNNKIFSFDSSRKYGEKWARCGHCKSYYLCEDFNETEEIATNYSICNKLEDGLMMNKYKSRLFGSVLKNAETYSVGKNGWLDIGCSYGGLLLDAQKHGFSHCHGTDIIREALDYCKTHGIQTHQCFSLGEIRSGLPAFDVISAIDSNMFWTNQPAELGIIHAHLHAGGIFIAKVVDRSWLINLVHALGISQTPFGKKAITKSIFNHRFSMPLASFVTVLDRCGFEVVRISVADALTSWEAGSKLKWWYRLSDLVYRFTNLNLSPSALVVARKKQ